MAGGWSPSGLMMVLLIACGPRAVGVDNDGDGWFSGSDCNDSNAAINPGVMEIPGDYLDNDCNPNTLDEDADQDGVLPPLDCEPELAFIPAAVEIPYDGYDNDCNVLTPDDDLDADGFGWEEDCDDQDPTVNPEAVEAPYDGIDNDCDPDTLDDDLDGDGVAGPDDCDDADPLRVDPFLWFLDCDGDGYAGRIPAPPSQSWDSSPVLACEAPATTPCPGVVGSWTRLEPVGAGSDPMNATVDCNDLEERTHPFQTDFFADSGGSITAPFDFDCDGANEPDYGGFTCFPIPSTSSCFVTPGYDTSLPQCGLEALFADACQYEATTSGCSMLDPVTVVVPCQ